jgi:hypothetical protein
MLKSKSNILVRGSSRENAAANAGLKVEIE